ncbi:hypothetical protein BUALT_Bualt12G0101500 [Buddleja alternifolia]|uniref:Transposase n=1 Tax=Buddleja alternifolia TaxID=168488 RepID=A0AAV6WQ88_9LAMI|nr:hypothetical protein BUALT_Bualt12G0101500 [Buddleja alternifolia]
MFGSSARDLCGQSDVDNTEGWYFSSEGGFAESRTDKAKKMVETTKAKGKKKVAETTKDKGKKNDAESEKGNNVPIAKSRKRVTQAAVDKGNKKVSEFDDSSDSDYIQPFYYSEDEEESVCNSEDEDEEFVQDVDSDTPSIILEDLETSNVEDANWYSDPGEEDEIQTLDTKDNDFPFFREGTNMKMFEPVVGMKFQNFKVYREVLRDYCVRNGYDLMFIRNDRRRITAKCKVETCMWRIHASPIQEQTVFKIKTFVGVHTCAKSLVNGPAKAKYLGKRMENQIRDNPTVPIVDLKKMISRKCGVEASRWKVIRAKRAAMETILGVDNTQYERLWDYCETVRARNPGSKILLKRAEGVEPPRFDRMYYSLHAMKMGFLSGCRPIIGLDGCFLKTAYCDTWSWFLTELFEDIGNVQGLVIISDRQKGLVEAVKTKAPNSEHRFCLRHMYQNFKVKFKDEKLKELFWRAASAANKADFQMFMKKIEAYDPKIS